MQLHLEGLLPTWVFLLQFDRLLQSCTRIWKTRKSRIVRLKILSEEGSKKGIFKFFGAKKESSGKKPRNRNSKKGIVLGRKNSMNRKLSQSPSTTIGPPLKESSATRQQRDHCMHTGRVEVSMDKIPWWSQLRGLNIIKLLRQKRRKRRRFPITGDLISRKVV